MEAESPSWSAPHRPSDCLPWCSLSAWRLPRRSTPKRPQPQPAGSRLIEDPAQQPNTPPTQSSYQLPAPRAVIQTLPMGIVSRIELHGTAMGTAPYVVALIEQKPGTAIDREAIRRSIRRLYQTQLFETIDVVWEPVGKRSGWSAPMPDKSSLSSKPRPDIFVERFRLMDCPRTGRTRRR